MLTDDYQFITCVRYTNFSTWAVKNYFAQNIKSKYPLEKIANLTNEKTKKIKLFNYPEDEHGILGVSNDIGMFDAYKEKGSKINQPYKIVDENNIAYNPYRINVGSIGIKTNNLENSYISPAYVVFDCKPNLLPQYMYLLLKSDKFNFLIKENTTGSVRQTLSYNKFSSIEIPVPTLEDQEKIVNQYNLTYTQAEECELKSNIIEESINKIFFNELEIKELSLEKSYQYKYIFNVKLSDLSRWDIWNKKQKFFSEKYKTLSLSSICTGTPLYGANEKAVKEKSDTRYIRITDINEDGSLTEDFASASNVNEKYLLKTNDFLIARSGNTVGKTFLYKPEYGKSIFAGYLIRFTLDTNKIIPEYLLYYTKSFIFKDWITSNQRIFGQPNINGQEYLASTIILPPLEVQQEISNKISKIKSQVKELRQKAQMFKKQAKQEFEREVFNE